MAEKLIEVRLRSITFEAERINSYCLQPLPGQGLPEFTAGSHIDVHLPGGIIRSYSLLNGQSERDQYMIAVNREEKSRGGSRHIHESWKVGDVLTIGPPRNNFYLVEDAPHSVLIAGGIGITPLLSMIARLEQLERSWELHYAARTRREAAFLDRLEKLKSKVRLNLHVSFHREGDGCRLDLETLLTGVPENAHLYCCGPVPMLEAFESATLSRPRDHVHVEYFAAKDAPAIEGGFEIICQRSGRTVAVPPGKTMLDALLDEGLNVSYSCSEGVCGTCETKVVSGIPDHRDLFLSREEQDANKTVMICCSGSKSPTLVLDI